VFVGGGGGGGGKGDKERVSGKTANHLNIHSWFLISIAIQARLIIQQGVLLYRLNRSNERIYGQATSSVS